MLVLLLTSAAILMGCTQAGHVLHPAAVRPGWSLTAIGGAAMPVHEPVAEYAANRNVEVFAPYRTKEALLQVNLGYGARLGEHQAVQLVAFIGNLSALSADLFFQLWNGPLDVGVGATAGLPIVGDFMPSAYGLLGHGWTFGSAELRLDGGYRYIHGEIPSRASYQTRGHGPMVLLTWLGGRSGLGAWADQVWLARPVLGNYCDDACDSRDTLAASTSLGLFVRMEL